jgi:uncharacterized protein YeaC (DUF1315 family)
MTMNLEQLLSTITPEIYQSMKKSIELGKWPDGRKLTKEQKALCMEAIIYFENKSGMPVSERTGYLDNKKMEKSTCSKDKKAQPAQPEETPVQVLNIQTDPRSL